MAPPSPSSRGNQAGCDARDPGGGATPLILARHRYAELYAEAGKHGQFGPNAGHYIGQRLTNAELVELGKEFDQKRRSR